ncbi:unnamed protein product [Mytilus coruscus]|uniref:B box-type domain-containing protein n=1 Tax=Mytilus coruscus TaxID=42192 RepID=A0A6J8AUR1_MYTCO|nr:unnamed protein product [Mytilus coruscus]
MASSTIRLCGPCEARHKTMTAVSWCIDCDDGLCSQCLEDHKYNKATCALCVPKKHKQCSRLKSIDELACHAKTSTELLDIERGIKDLENTLDELRNDRQRNIDAINYQKEIISGKIKSFKNQINKLLNKLELEWITQLEFHSDKYISKIDTLISQLNERETKVKSLGETINQMKETCSDLQVFLATKSLGEKLREELESVSTLCNQDAAKESVLKLSIDLQLENLLSGLKGVGAIQVVQNPCQVKAGAWEQQRAQLDVPITAVKDIDQTELKLIREISIGSGTGIKDCVLVKDGRMIFANDNNNMVLVQTPEGLLSKSISVDKSPFGLAVISSNTVAVTCRDDKTINIVNIDDCVVKQKIKVGKPCCGLSYHDDKLYVLVARTGIMEFDLAGNIIRTIPIDVPNSECYLSYYKDTFCYTCYQILDERYIACCDNNGSEIWRLGVADSGVTADNYGNYFASNSDSTLQIVSADGKKTKQLLDLRMGSYLEGVFFDKNSSTLLVSCSSGTASLYRVI